MKIKSFLTLHRQQAYYHNQDPERYQELGVDRYAFFRADADTDYYRPTRPITDILNRYMSGVKMTINVKI